MGRSENTDKQEDELLEVLKACETDVWNALASGDIEADMAALDDEFLGVYADGFASRQEHVEQLANGPSISSFVLSDFHYKQLGPAYALLSYHAKFLRSGKDSEEAMYVTSIWRQKGERWINVFSQDTPTTLSTSTD